MDAAENNFEGRFYENQFANNRFGGFRRQYGCGFGRGIIRGRQ
jgi:hypothetical protein